MITDYNLRPLLHLERTVAHREIAAKPLPPPGAKPGKSAEEKKAFWAQYRTRDEDHFLPILERSIEEQFKGCRPTPTAPAGMPASAPTFERKKRGGNPPMLIIGNPPSKSEKRLDKEIEAAYYRHGYGVQVDIMDIGKIFRDAKLEMSAGVPLDVAMQGIVARYRKNPGESLVAKSEYSSEVEGFASVLARAGIQARIAPAGYQNYGVYVPRESERHAQKLLRENPSKRCKPPKLFDPISETCVPPMFARENPSMRNPYRQTDSEFVWFLTNTLIPDLIESGNEMTAESFTEGLDYLHGRRDQGWRNYVHFLDSTLVPDLKDSGSVETAKDFARLARMVERKLGRKRNPTDPTGREFTSGFVFWEGEGQDAQNEAYNALRILHENGIPANLEVVPGDPRKFGTWRYRIHVEPPSDPTTRMIYDGVLNRIATETIHGKMSGVWPSLTRPSTGWKRKSPPREKTLEKKYPILGKLARERKERGENCCNPENPVVTMRSKYGNVISRRTHAQTTIHPTRGYELFTEPTRVPGSRIGKGATDPGIDIHERSLPGWLGGKPDSYWEAREKRGGNPPRFAVIDSASGVIQYTKVATGTGTEAFNKAYERAKDMANKLGRIFFVLLEIQGAKVGQRYSVEMMGPLGATEVRPDSEWGGPPYKGNRHKVKRGKNPSHGLPSNIENDPRFQKELRAYRRRHGSGPVEVRVVKVPKGYPKYMSVYGEAPHAVYDAPSHSIKGKRIHHFGKKGKNKPWLVSSAERGPKFLAYVGGQFRAGTDWLYD